MEEHLDRDVLAFAVWEEAVHLNAAGAGAGANASDGVLVLMLVLVY